jgi:DNA-directed RNA polymerase alpha subunit
MDLEQPVRDVKFAIHDCMLNYEEEMLFVEIWTNLSMTPIEALYEASHKLCTLFQIGVYKNLGYFVY